MFAVNIAGALVTILLLPVMLLYPPASGHRSDVVVRDEAGIYYGQIPRHGLEEQYYDREVRIVVLSVPGAGIGNLNEGTVKYTIDGAQSSSWFWGSDVSNPVDGTVLFVVALESHWVCCYAMEDSQLFANKRRAIENAAGSHYAQDDWDGGAVAMGQQLATYIGSGDGNSTMMQVAGAVLALMIGSGWFAFYMRQDIIGQHLGRAAHRKIMQVVYDYDLTELKTETLPAQPSQSRGIGSGYRRLLAEYDVVNRAWKNFEEPCGTRWFDRGVRAQTARLTERTASLVEPDAAVNAGVATRAGTIQNPGGTAL